MAQGRHYLQMDGKEVFRHAVVRMPESVRAVLAGDGRDAGAASTLLMPHQANLRISEMVQKELGLRDDQVYNNIQYYGNTTAATIPIALDECVRERPGEARRPRSRHRVRIRLHVGKCVAALVSRFPFSFLVSLFSASRILRRVV